MASLKTLKTRIKSVKSTQKITKAMKMVAAAKLRRAKETAEAARPYAERMEALLANLAASITSMDTAPRMLAGNGKSDVHLIVAATSDRGLCGAFNSSIVRATRRKIAELTAQGKQVKLFCIGRKGYEQLQNEYGRIIIDRVSEIAKKKIEYSAAATIARELAVKFEAGEFDVAWLVYNKFKSAISQIVTFQQLMPLPRRTEELKNGRMEENSSIPQFINSSVPYEYEPEETEILTDLLPRNLGVQIFRGLLENAASEQGARMSAMDNATRNAGEMIKKLTLVYNRTRQATITKELIEIISGAEAL